MKINGVGAGTRIGIEKKRETSKAGGFQALLENSVDKVEAHEQSDSESFNERQQPNREAVQLFKDAASMLDRAMNQIQGGGEPNPDVVESLRQLSHRLGQTGTRSADGNEVVADTIVAVEAQRLKDWE